MARSNYIYVVLDRDEPLLSPLLAAFTVRHELISWLNEHDDMKGITVHRMRDGQGWRDNVNITKEVYHGD